METRVAFGGTGGANILLDAPSDDLRDAVADLVHDLRTPISTLMLSASQLPATDAAKTIRAELVYVEAMLRGLEGLLDGPHAPGAVDLADLIQRIGHRFAPLASDRELGFEVATAEPTPPVLADAIGVERAVGNLVQNAIQWAHGNVVLLAWHEGNAVYVEVLDDGPGIGVNGPQILERGVRGSNARGRGFGLGLAIAEAAARRHNGRLQLDDRPQGGTRALLVLPIRDAVRAG